LGGAQVATARQSSPLVRKVSIPVIWKERERKGEREREGDKEVEREGEREKCN
jgi:hypothetical protein